MSTLAVPCSEPHTAEAIGVFELQEEVPFLKFANGEVDDECSRILAAYAPDFFDEAARPRHGRRQNHDQAAAKFTDDSDDSDEMLVWQGQGPSSVAVCRRGRVGGGVEVDNAEPAVVDPQAAMVAGVSQSGSQAAAFFREVASQRTVWYVRDDQGSPAPRTSSGQRAMPYWSSQARAQRAADIWGGGLRTVSVSMETWRTEELPDLNDEGYRVGINWTGPRLVGWDFTVAEVLNRLAHALREGPYSVDHADKS